MSIPTVSTPESNVPKLVPDDGLPGAKAPSMPEPQAPEQAQNPSKPVIGGLLNHFSMGSSAGEGAAGGIAEDAVAAAV